MKESFSHGLTDTLRSKLSYTLHRRKSSPLEYYTVQDIWPPAQVHWVLQHIIRFKRSTNNFEPAVCPRKAVVDDREFESSRRRSLRNEHIQYVSLPNQLHEAAV